MKRLDRGRSSDDRPVYIAAMELTATLHVSESDPGNSIFRDISMWLFRFGYTLR